MEEIHLKIDDLDMLGRGIAHCDGKAFFVNNALINETIIAKPLFTKNNIVFCDNIEILKESEDRVTPPCPYYNLCGGCDLQHLKYSKTLEFKKNQLITTFKKVAKIDISDLNIELIECKNQYHYRNKVALKIDYKNNDFIIGLTKKSSHEIVDIDDCLICDEKIKIIITLVREFLSKNKTKIIENDTCLISHLVVRIIENKTLLTFVSIKDLKINFDELFANLKHHFNIVGINVNLNKSKKEILSHKFIHKIGAKKLEINVNNISFEITNGSFMQVNLDIQDKIYKTVCENITKDTINAFSGAGLLTALISKNNVNKVYGLEINKEAHKLAEQLKEKNNIQNMINLCGNANQLIETLNLANFDLVIDPPRNGIDKNFVKTILNNLPDKIIYVSCNPTTLANNIKSLSNKYVISKIFAYDMFCQTKNLETLVILEKVK